MQSTTPSSSESRGWGPMRSILSLPPTDLPCDLSPFSIRVKFLATFLSRVNQHEAAVLANKFPNLHLYGCWWYCNNPSIIREVSPPTHTNPRRKYIILPSCAFPRRSPPSQICSIDQMIGTSPLCRSRRCVWRSWARASRRSTATPVYSTSWCTSGTTPDRWASH